MTNLIKLPNNVVSITDNQVKTSSLKVAEFFSRQHKNVLQSIENLDCSEDFNGLNFKPVEYLDKKGEKRQSYEMTKDGFMFLVMGFTGKKAAAIKEAYINAFNEMAQKMSDQKHEAFKKALNELGEVYICPEQKAALQGIVDRRVNSNHSLRAQMWKRHNHHFKINSYTLLPANRFDESVAYLEAMELNIRVPQAQTKALPPAQRNEPVEMPTAMQMLEFGITVNKDNLYCLLTYVSYLTDFWNIELDPILRQMRSPLAGNMNEYRHISNVIAKSMLRNHFSDHQQMKLLP